MLLALFLAGLFSADPPPPVKFQTILGQRSSVDATARSCVCSYENYAVPCSATEIPEAKPGDPTGILPCRIKMVIPEPKAQ